MIEDHVSGKDQVEKNLVLLNTNEDPDENEDDDEEQRRI